MTEYSKCPCGQPLKAIDVGVYACPLVNVAGSDSDGRWVRYLAAWCCTPGWVKYQRAIAMGHKEPPVNPRAVEVTRQVRAALRAGAGLLERRARPGLPVGGGYMADG